MSPQSQLEQRGRELLPTVAKVFSELGYQNTSMREVARRCEVPPHELRELWPTKTALFIAAIEYAYDVAERTWKMLLHPEASADAAERLLAFAAHCGDEFTVSNMLWVGLAETDKPRIRNTLRRINRKLARFLACEVADLHVAAIGGDDEETSLRSQAGTVLRLLAHVQQEADQLAEIHRHDALEICDSAVQAANIAATDP